jgi:hypothetical protein
MKAQIMTNEDKERYDGIGVLCINRQNIFLVGPTPTFVPQAAIFEIA